MNVDSSDDEPAYAKPSTVPFVPIHIAFSWIEPDTTANMHSYIIDMPTGIPYNKFKLNVLDNERLELILDWPKALCKPDLMHKKWISNSDGDSSGSVSDHLRKVAMENILKTIRRTASSKIFGRWVSEKTPFKVRKDIDFQHNLRLTDNACIIYVTLRAIASDYADEGNRMDFEDV